MYKMLPFGDIFFFFCSLAVGILKTSRLETLENVWCSNEMYLLYPGGIMSIFQCNTHHVQLTAQLHY